jgi:aerobic carbon-monoxide dehydrogenase medium subunit
MAVASVASDAATEVLMPASEDEAIAAFGDGADITVVGGGTIVVPDLTYRRIRPSKALLLGRAGLAGIEKDGAARVTIGAMTPVQDLVDMPAPLGPCASNVADLEIRSQGTVGGNICAGESHEAPRGDLQGAFLALGAMVRSAAGGDVTEEPLEDFLPKRDERLLLGVSYDEPAAGAFAGLDRPHTHDYTALAVSGARAADGTVRLAVTGAGSWGVRLPSAEAAAGDPAAAGEAALQDVTPHDDALASAWYRKKVLPVLVRRVLADLEESA